jgi:cAMP-dependent protein kinase regulator
MVESHSQDFEMIRERFERLLKIPSEKRTEENLFELMRLTAKLKIFENFKMSNIHKEICKHIYIKTLERGEIIFKQGDEGDAYYFVLRGCIDLYVYDVDQIDGKIKLKVLASILPNNGFGELALLYDCPRTATAIPNTRSDLVIFKKKMYTNFVKDLHEKELFELVKFYYSVPIFKKEPISNIIKYCLRTNKRILNSYETFMPYGEYVHDYCFLKSGVIKAFWKVKLNNHILEHAANYKEEDFVSKMKELQTKQINLKNFDHNTNTDPQLIYEDVLEIMEFHEKDMFAEFYAAKSKKLEIFLLPTLPSEIITIKVDDFKKVNPNLQNAILTFSGPIFDSERVFKRFQKNLVWKKTKSNLLYNCLKKKD